MVKFFWPRSNFFDCSHNIFWTSIWIRHECQTWNSNIKWTLWDNVWKWRTNSKSSVVFLKDIIPCFRLLIATGVVLFHKPSQTSPNCPCPSLRTNFKLFLSISHWSFVEWDRSAVTGFSICKKKYEKWKYEKYSFCTKVPALKVRYSRKNIGIISIAQKMCCVLS